jgi:hypothetical protein
MAAVIWLTTGVVYVSFNSKSWWIPFNVSAPPGNAHRVLWGNGQYPYLLELTQSAACSNLLKAGGKIKKMIVTSGCYYVYEVRDANICRCAASS